MRRLTPWHIAALAGAAAVIALIAFRILGGPGEEAQTPAPAALVTLAPIRSGQVRESVSAYGVIAGSAAASRTVSAPRAVIVERLLVGPGQPVAAGAVLVELANTPATQLAFRQASDAVRFAAADLERVRRLYDQHLAARDQLDAAQKAVADANAALAAQAQAGAGTSLQTLRAPFAGIIGAVPVALGDHVAADAPLMTVVAAGGLVAKLGVEPAKAARMAAGRPVTLTLVFDRARRLDTSVGIVGRQIDPATRLVDVTAAAPGAGLALGDAVEGEVTVGAHPGLLAPRAALITDEAGSHVFVVRAGKAHEVAVTPGLDEGDQTEVAGAIRAGELVAVEGAYQLQDGMAVRTAPR
jgi:RND family efflux transporter MFP subunit